MGWVLSLRVRGWQRARRRLARAVFAFVLALVLTSGGAGGCRDTGGERVEIIERGTRRVGTLKNGRKHGEWRAYFAGDSLMSVETYRYGVRHGPERIWDLDSGTVLGDMYWKNGKAHGRSRTFYDNGQLMEIGWYRFDFRAGEWCFFDEDDGRVSRVTNGSLRPQDRAAIDDSLPLRCSLLEGSGAAHRDLDNTDYRRRAPPPNRRGTVHRRLPLP